MKKNILKKVLPYKLRNATMALAATVAGMTTTSCEEDEILQEQPKKEQIQKHSEYLNFYLDASEATVEKPNDMDKIRDIEYMTNLSKRDDVDSIFIVPCGYRLLSGTAEAFELVGAANFFEPVFSVSKKINGRGAIYIKSGEATKIFSDSLFLTQHGMPVNPKKR